MIFDIKNLLNSSVNRAGISQQVGAVNAVNAAGDIISQLFDAELSSKMTPQYLKNGALAIKFATSITAQEFRFKEEEFIEKINKKLGAEKVKRVKYLT
jgi:hypothetical protein